MKYLSEFLFYFFVITTLMFFGTMLFKIWPEDERLICSASFALGASLVNVAVSAARTRKKS
jgi:hypothetical protein